MKFHQRSKRVGAAEIAYINSDADSVEEEQKRCSKEKSLLV